MAITHKKKEKKSKKIKIKCQVFIKRFSNIDQSAVHLQIVNNRTITNYKVDTRDFANHNKHKVNKCKLKHKC